MTGSARQSIAQNKTGLLRRSAPRHDVAEMLDFTSPLVGEVGSLSSPDRWVTE
jgi:hypothetical protein